MKRNVDINQISDGKLYELNDMVKAGCDGCKNCYECCRGMGNTVVLDPYDVHRLTKRLNLSFESLLNGPLELNVVDGIILPNLKMDGDSHRCHFLNDEGRCSVHPARPSICRLFPLGRFYENDDFKYFLQIHECPKKNKTKVRVKSWIDTENIKEYEQYIREWHYMLVELQTRIANSDDEEYSKKVSMYILQQFYITPISNDDNVYGQLTEKIERAKSDL